MEIPNNVETIAPACFLGHSEILGVNIPNSVTIIGEEAFKDCTSLQEVHGASNVVKIQDRAFENTNLNEITIHEYVEEQRIKKAANMLITTDYTLAEIAYECGFSSQSYFSYAFKRKMNKTPREYAKEVFERYGE